MYDFYMKTDLKTMLYQMFILGLEGDNLDENPNLRHALKEGLGGIIFFTQNIKTKTGFKKLVEDIKKEAKTPLFLSIDQEGGRVERTENLFGGKKFLSAKFAAKKGETFIEEQTEQISHLLKDLGLNLNFAPCVDVNTNPNNPIIGERAFSSNPDEVVKFGKIVTETYLKNDIIPCLKHFPGHGNASVDSHILLPQMDLTLEEMKKLHIKPFREIKSPMIMVAHMHCTAFDKETIPSSLSENVIGYLRNSMAYNGLIITDDMVMGAVNKISAVDSCVSAINAGVNILLYRNSFDETIQVINIIAKLALKDKQLSNNIETSYNKILDTKHKLLHQ